MSLNEGSFWSVKKLPSKLGPGNVNNIRKHHTLQNLMEKPEDVFRTVASKKHVGSERGCFEKTKYLSLDYERESDSHKGAIQVQNNEFEALGRRPFKTKMRAPIKSEDQFGDPIVNNGDPVSAASAGIVPSFKIFRADFTEGDEFIHGPFYLYFKKNGETSRQSVDKWTPALFKQLQKDWSHLKFKVKFTTDDEMLIQFFVGTRTRMGGIDRMTTQTINNDIQYKDEINTNINIDTITKYMNRLVTHGLASEFNLSKRGDRWGIIEIVKSSVPATTPSNDKNVNRENTINDKNVIQELYITYSLFPPWQNRGPLLAAKSEKLKSKSIKKIK